MDYGESDKMYPVLLMPKQCTSFETNHDATDYVFNVIKITSPDTEGNESNIYSSLCNVKFVDSYDQCINDVDVNGQADLNETRIPIHHANQSYAPYSLSQVWIDPERSPHIFNNNGDVGSEENNLVHQQSQHTAVQQQNTYNYMELMQNLNPVEEFEHKKFRKTPVTDTNFYQYNEFESGNFLTHLPEEIMPENEQQQNDLQRDNDALEQLMSSDIQSSSKQQKIILYSGHDCHGQTIQKIRVNDPFLECVENEVEKEVIAETPTNRKKYQCEKCAKLFDQITAFKQHMVRSHRSKMPTIEKDFATKCKFLCSQCGKVLKSQKKYETHCFGHGNSELECAKCHKVFATKFTLRNHQKVHQKKFQCVYCKKSYHYGRKLKNHLKKIHRIFICDVCDYSVSEYSELQAHKSTHREIELKQTDENSYILTLEDDITVNNSSTLAASSADFTMKSDEDQTRLDKIENADSDIAKVMANEVFMSHSTKVLKYKKYKKSCNICLKSFGRAGDLKRHLIEHVVRSTLDKTPVNQNGRLTIKCEICQLETFSTVDKFKAHLREHAKLTLYKCTSCDKSFSDSSNFSKHKKVHGPTFFQCDLCQRKFHSKKMIVRHMEYHKNNTPISCFFCDKEFHFSSTLNKHIKSAHTRERAKFRCKFCKEYFNTLREKWDHEWLVHHVRKMNANCWICESQFRKYSDLKRHCILAHDMKIPRARKLLLANT